MASEDNLQPSTSRGGGREDASNDTPTVDFDYPESYVRRHLNIEEILQMWNLAKLVRELGTREQCVTFAEAQGLVATTKICRNHKRPMNIEYSTNKTVGAFACNKGACRGTTRVSRAKGSWFENAKIPLPHIFYLMYCYSWRFSYDKVIQEDILKEELGACLSRATICDWYSYCREVVVLYQLAKQEHRGKIGGPGKVVQIDESKFGKRKFNKGRRIEGHWVLGLIEDGSEDLRLEVCPENIRSSEVLVPLIKKHVAEGSTIHTDYWRAYDCLSEHGYVHKKVNHSDPDNPFIAPDGTHTQRIESQWRVVKKFFKMDNYFNTLNFADLTMEYLWRRSVIQEKRDPFIATIIAIKHVYKV